MRTTTPTTRSSRGIVLNRLRKCRRSRGLKQREVAAILGLQDSAIISRWEQGVSMPNTVNTIRLAVVYRTMTDAFYPLLRDSLQDELLQREADVLGRVESINKHFVA